MIGFLLKVLGPRWWLHLLPYVLIGIVTAGVFHKLFIQPTNTVTIGKGGTQFNITSGDDATKVPMFGCAAWRIHADLYYKRPTPILKGEKKDDK